MKNLLLSLATVALGLTASAATVEFDFTISTYGIAGQVAGSQNEDYINIPATITEGNVKIELNGTGPTAWRFWTDGLRQYRSNGANFTVSTLDNQNITSINWTTASGVQISLAGTETTLENGWSGNQSSVTFDTPNSTNNNGIKTLTITYGEGGGETPDPEVPEFNVAQALAWLAEGNQGEAIVTGIITSIQEISTSYGNATYFIGDSADASVTLEIYRGYGLNGEKFTSEDQLAVGATVKVSGTLVDYNGTGTYEFTTGSQILEYKAPTENPGETVWTVAEALDQIAAGYEGSAVVEGYIVSIKEVSTQYGNATFTIADNTTYTEGLIIFRTKYVDNVPFSSKNQIAVGGKVKMSGMLTIYDAEAEMVSCRMLSYTAPEGGNPSEPEGPDEGGVEKVIFSETFTESLGSFTTYGELPEGLTYVWSWGGANYGAKASAYVSGTRYDVANWLVSPEIDLSGYTDVYINFDNALNYLDGNAADDFVGIYVGAAGSNPSEANWTNLSNEIEFGSGSNWTFVASGDAPVVGYDGQKVQFAFLYQATSTVAPTWEVKNFTVNGTTVSAGIESIDSEVNGNAEYYTLQGIRVNNPVKGGLYIIRQGNNVTKAIIR